MSARVLVLTAVVATLAACATGPTPSSSLEQARQKVRSAQADPRIVSLAALELKRAEEALRATEKIWAADGSPAIVDHHAYMTGQRVALARETAASLADQAVTANGAAERDRMRLASRTAEADAAGRQLAESQRAGAQKSADLAAAQAQSDRNEQTARQQQARVGNLETQLAELNAKKTDRGVVVTLGDVLFDSGQSELRAGAGRQMMKIAEAMRSDATRTAAIEGYTDNVGSAASNRELSGRRALAVMNALVSLGVSPQHLTTASRGEDAPVASNGTALGRQMNRRVEIVFSRANE